MSRCLLVKKAVHPATRGHFASGVLGLTALLAIAGCGREGGFVPPDSTPVQDAGQPVDAGPMFSDSAIARTDLSIDRVVPNHGPFRGGNQVILRGSGFTADALVTIGGREVQGADHELIDSRRLGVVAPAGEVGPADVTVTVDGATVTLEDGYFYDAIYVDPSRGSIAGGTFVTVTGTGTDFEEGDTVLLGRTECEDVQVVSTSRITCRTPPGSTGFVDVIVRDGEDGSEAIASDAFEYYESSDSVNGGLGGGPISGVLNITVVNAGTGEPVEEAFAIIGEDLSTEYQGLTNAVGQITFSGPDVMGPLTIHVAKHCFERTSFVAFDAMDVTIFLVPWMTPECAPPSAGGGGGRGRNPAIIDGHLVWPTDMSAMTWFNVPEAREGWQRVAYVYTTIYETGYPNPNPAAPGTRQRVLETSLEEGGYPYRIVARPAGLAVYALAGLEEMGSGRFVPYVMGVARNVLAGPGETVYDVDILMTIPLDHYIEAELGSLPRPASRGPDQFRLDALLDLGGEGLVHRVVNTQDFDILRARDTSRPFRFLAEPALERALANGRFRIIAGWHTSEFDRHPETVVVQNGITNIDAIVELPDFLAIPRATAPAWGERLPADRILRWEAGDGEEPDLYYISIVGADQNPAWRMFVPGSVTEAPMPNLAAIPELQDIPSGNLAWGVYAIKIPGFDFNTLSYAHLNDRYWSHYAADSFLALR